MNNWENTYKQEKKDHFITKIGLVIFFITTLFFAYISATSPTQADLESEKSKESYYRTLGYQEGSSNCLKDLTSKLETELGYNCPPIVCIGNSCSGGAGYLEWCVLGEENE